MKFLSLRSLVSLSIILLPPPFLILLTNCSTKTTNNTILQPVALKSCFDFKSDGENVNTFYKTKQTKEKFINKLDAATIFSYLPDYVVSGQPFYKEEIDVTVDPTLFCFTLAPKDNSVHYIKNSKTDPIYYQTYFTDLATKPETGVRMVINFTGEGEDENDLYSYPTVADMAAGLAENGYFPNQLLIPEIGNLDTVKVNDFIYKAKISVIDNESIFYANSFVVNFVKAGISLGDMIIQKDLGTVAADDDTSGKELTIGQIREQVKEFNPSIDDEVVEHLTKTSDVRDSYSNSSITRTMTLQVDNTIDWITGDKTVTCKVLSVAKDSLYVKFNTNETINVDDGDFKATVNSVIDSNGWRSCSGMNINHTNGLDTGKAFFIYQAIKTGSQYRKLNIEWNWNNKYVIAVAGHPAGLQKMSIMRQPQNPVLTTLDLHLLIAPDLAGLNTHTGVFNKYIFPNVKNFSSNLFSKDNPSNILNYEITSTQTEAEFWTNMGDDYKGFGPNCNANLCTDISFYMFTDVTLKFKQIVCGTISSSTYKWKPEINIHLPFGSKTKIKDTYIDCKNTSLGYVQWNYIYDLN